MTPTRILAAHDGSQDADTAFESALDFAALCKARLQVVSVARRELDLETRILVGHAAEQILRLAGDTGADLIVVGHRGRSTIREWLFGSTSRRIVAHAACSVLVVRQK